MIYDSTQKFHHGTDIADELHRVVCLAVHTNAWPSGITDTPLTSLLFTLTK